MRKEKAGFSPLGATAFPTRVGWVAALCSDTGIKGLSLPSPTLDDAVADCLKKAGQVLSEGEKHLLEAIMQGGRFLPALGDRMVELVDGWLANVEGQLTRFYSGKKVPFGIPLDWFGLTAWQRRVLEEVAGIPWGETRSYAWLADRLGNPAAARAVGSAVARNPFPPVVPCHRVIKADGSLGGYGGGQRLKRTLLEREGCLV